MGDMIRFEDAESGEALYVRPSEIAAIYKAGKHTYIRIGCDNGFGSFPMCRPVRGTPDDVRGMLARAEA